MAEHRVGHAGDGVTIGSSLWMDAPGHELALRALFGTSAWLARDAPARAVVGRGAGRWSCAGVDGECLVRSGPAQEVVPCNWG